MKALDRKKRSCCIAIATLEPVNGDSWYHMCAFRFHYWGRKVNWDQASHVRASSASRRTVVTKAGWSITCDPPFNESRVMFYLFEPVSALQSFHWRAIFKLRFLLASFLSLLRIDSLACFWFFPLCSAFLSFHLVWNGLVKLVACSHLAVPAAWFAILILGSESGSSFRSLGTFHHGRSLEALWYGQLQASSREFL